jgi:hypothetical protein
MASLSVCAEAWEAPSPGAVSALQPDRHARGSRRDGWSRNSPGTCGIVATRCTGATEAGLQLRASCCSPRMQPWSTRPSVPISLAPDLGVAPGQPDRWTLNQRWKVRMLAGWDHQPNQQVRPCAAAVQLSLPDVSWPPGPSLLRQGRPPAGSATSVTGAPASPSLPAVEPEQSRTCHAGYARAAAWQLGRSISGPATCSGC